MTVILSPGGPFGQAASLCFLLCSVWGDVLLIRLFLFAAYCFLIFGRPPFALERVARGSAKPRLRPELRTALLRGFCLRRRKAAAIPAPAAGAATGYPRWGSSFTLSGGVSVDGLIWAGACLLLHGFALGRLLLDERPIKFRSEDEEQLWRFFYRRGGMRRLEMQEVGGGCPRIHTANSVLLRALFRCLQAPPCACMRCSPGRGLGACTAHRAIRSLPARRAPQVLRYGGWRRVSAGQRIVGPGESRVQLCLLVEGLAELRAGIFGEDAQGAWRPLHSGALFDKRILNVFGEREGVLAWVGG